MAPGDVRDEVAADAAAPVARVHWSGWDGRRLAFEAVLPAARTLELLLDGAVFQRWPDVAGERGFAVAFDLSPSGNVEMEFSLAFDGAALGEPWRVRHGQTAKPGESCWLAAARGLRPLAGTPRLPGAALPPVAVVVPIHDAAASVARCLLALARWTPPDVRLILIDDASTDPAIGDLLERCAREHGAQVVRQSENLGYTRSVNAGIALAGAADVVLLNSDTEVGPHWLPALQLAAYADARTGTATAVSDNAGAFSVPELEQYCPPPAHWRLADAQRAVLQNAGLLYPVLPTGNGFCMYVRRALIERIGAMDADAFPYGYGEENDFCQRALRAGWRHVIAGNVFVRHERSASFGDARRAALGADGMAVLRRRYPGYEREIEALLPGFARRVLDWRVRRAWADAADAPPPRRRVLLAANDAGAAAALAAAIAPACEAFMLHCAPPSRLCDASGTIIATFAGDPLAGDARALRAWLVAQAIEDIVAAPTLPAAQRLAAIAAGLRIATWPDPATFARAAQRNGQGAP